MYNEKVYISIYMIITSMCFMYMCVHMCIHLEIYVYIYISISKNNVYIYIYIIYIYIYLYQTHPIQEHHPVKNPSNKNLLHLGDELNLLRIDFGETASGRKGMDSDGKKH